MPVDGLPTTLEIMMNSLLLTNRLSSFKIAGNPSATTIVLRFGVMAARGTASPRVVEGESDGPLRTPLISPGVWRRKSQRQQQRDQQRHEHFIANKPSYSNMINGYHSSFEPHSSTPTPSSLFLSTTGMEPNRSMSWPTLSTDKISTVNVDVSDRACTDKSTPVKPSPTPSSSENNPPVCSSDTHCGDQFSGVSSPQPCESVDILTQSGDIVNNTETIVNTENGSMSQHKIEIESVNPNITPSDKVPLDPVVNDNLKTGNKRCDNRCRKNYSNFQAFKEEHDVEWFRYNVKSLVSKTKARLMDRERNRYFKKSAFTTSGGKKSMVLQTDDIIVECDLDEFKMTYWFSEADTTRSRELSLKKLLQTVDDGDKHIDPEYFCFANMCVEYVLKLIDEILIRYSCG